MRAAPAIVLGLAACGSDPTLDVVVHHPAGPDISITTITVYASSGLTCDDIQFGDVDATTLAGLQVAQETLTDGAVTAGTLDGLPRVDHKVIVARGFGADGKLAAGGCVEQGEVTSDLTLTIDTQIAVLASFESGAANASGSGSDSGDIYRINVRVADPTGNAVAGREVSWRVIGPEGTMPAYGSDAVAVAGLTSTWQRPAPTCTDASGAATIHPVPPDLSGGYAARVRVAWTQDAPSPFTSLTKLGVALRPLAAGSDAAHPCVIGHSASAAAPRVVACLDHGVTTDSVDVFSVSAAAGNVTYGAVAQPTLTKGVGVFALPNGSDTDVLALDAGSIPARLVPVYGTSGGGTCTGCGTFLDVQYVPACGDSPALLLGRTTLNEVKQLPPLGGTATAFPIPLPAGDDIAFVGAGCVNRLDTSTHSSKLVQVVVLDYESKALGRVHATKVLFDCAGSCTSIDLPVPGAGVAFTTGAAPPMITTTVDATGVVLSTVVMVTAGGASQFLELSRAPSASVPHRIAAGQLDTDGQLDFAWDNTARSNPTLQLSYARSGFDGNLSALTPQLGDLDVIDVQGGDVNGDGHDDIVVVTSAGTLVLPSLVTAATAAIGSDSTTTCP